MADKIDSNLTGLRFAEETGLRTLPTFTDPEIATGTLTFGAAGEGGNLATGVLTFSGVGVVDDVIVIGARTYTLKASVATTANQVLIGLSAAATAANLAAAIMLTGTPGTDYGSATTLNANVSAVAVGAVVTVTAKAVGVAANSYSTTTTSGAASWGAATMTGGAAGEVIVIGSKTYNLVDVLSSPTAANEILVGATASGTAANLTAAINLTGTAGIEYSAGTTIHANVAAVRTGAVVSVAAKVTGAAANSYATTTTMASGFWAEATMVGGVDAVGIPPAWHPLEPNSYSDFGGQISTVARNPINPIRQRKKGVTTDLDASGGFNQDVTFDNTTRLLQGFLFADIREKKTTNPLNGTQRVISAASGALDTYTSNGNMTGFLAGNLVLATGFAESANNGLKVAVGDATANVLTVTDGLVTEASPPATAALKTVGHQFTNGTLNVVMSGGLVVLTRASGTDDYTTLGLIPGEWIYVGGDASGVSFANNGGFARVSAVTTSSITLDKVGWIPVAETGAGKTVRVFFGDVIRNEDTPSLIKRRTYQVERTLGTDDNGTMVEYLVGAVCNELTLNMSQADKVTIDMSFIAVDNEQRDGTQGVKDGTRPSLRPGDAFNTSSDFSRIKLAIADPEDSSPTALFAFATEMSVSINNNASPNKAIGVLGAFDVSIGTFEVGGKMTAYFANVDAVRAVRNNSDVTLDIAMVKNNQGMLFDLPLVSLGDGRLAVEQDQPITIPLETNAAESSFGHTLLFVSFSYLPDLAS